MTLEQQDLIVKWYKNGKTYKEISYLTGIPMGTVSSFLARKHKNLKTLRTLQRKKELHHYTKYFAESHELLEDQAQTLYEIMRNRFDTKKKNAIKDGRVFTVRFSDLSFPKECPVLGIPLDYWSENNRVDGYPSFDRIDNSKDYVTGNVQIISWRANRLKSDSSPKELRLIADYLDKLSEGT